MAAVPGCGRGGGSTKKSCGEAGVGVWTALAKGVEVDGAVGLGVGEVVGLGTVVGVREGVGEGLSVGVGDAS